VISTKEQEAKWAEEKKYHAARYVWPRRHYKTPKQMVTWEQWWEKMFQDNYREYTNKMMAKKKRQMPL
jgi:hypothetical protein